MNKKINLLLLSNSKKRTKYFNAIKNHCSFDTKVYYYSNPFALKNLFSLQKHLDFSREIQEKITEIEFKYKNKNPLFHWLYKSYIKIVTPILASNFLNALKSHKANMVGIWNGKKYPENIMLKVAHFAKVQPIFFENGLLPNTTVVDAKGVNATNSVPREANFFKEFPINLERVPKKLQARELAAKRVLRSANLEKEYIFVPFQTSFDSQILKHSPWIKDMNELFFLLSEIAKKLQLHIIFKEHPSEKLVSYEALHQIAAKNPFVEFANANSTQELIEYAKAIVTINSSVGLESLLFEKKVILLGEAFYAIKELTLQASSKEELEELLRNIDKWSFNKRVRDGFLSYLINEYLVYGDWRKPSKEHFISLEQKIESLRKQNG